MRSAQGTASRARYGAVIFDVDSTVTSIEGIDWLAERRGEPLASEIRALTEGAMAGAIPLEQVYVQRLALIRPTRDELRELGAAYVAAVQPGARALCAVLLAAGCELALVSGGLREAILPLAHHLGVDDEDLHAVDIDFDEGGAFVGLRGDQPLATTQGKPRVLHGLRGEFTRPVVMVGDGSTDAATRGVSDAFIAYTGVTRRESVVAVADAEAADFRSLYSLLMDGTP
ncbi:MAG TPA: HAD-IB family phosphatase [Gemmatimonas sp.]|nr:HAD-IB family phosphatase [Gemmatimonas sp.]